MKYNQLRAMFAITKASFTAMWRSPSAVVFSFVFPFIFILIFGFLGNGDGRPRFNVYFEKNSDTLNELYSAIKNTAGVSLKRYTDNDSLQKDLKAGNISAMLSIQRLAGAPVPYTISMRSTTASNDQWPQLQNLIKLKINEASDKRFPDRPVYAHFDFDAKRDIEVIREYRTIDFILPGQLGFSLLSTGVFGVAFMFFNLRNTLVLKRFFATPISRTFIILGEALSRLTFQLITAVVIIVVGYYFFNFTLVHGFFTFLEMLFLSFLGLLIFMGFGYMISGLAKNDSSIPPFANLITLPQFLLSGTFFSITNFPEWLQVIAKLLPLTYLNMAMRKVAFEGVHFWNVTTVIPFGNNLSIPVVGILIAWGILVYAIAIKVFRWE